ncbi:hypothetical protein [Streptomyces kanamyceticus]|uniref:hypothetical protein n=1 Tax=Streptomyces kanamyceticus TaxID=1967 RepID=UPI0037DDAA7D
MRHRIRHRRQHRRQRRRRLCALALPLPPAVDTGTGTGTGCASNGQHQTLRDIRPAHERRAARPRDGEPTGGPWA